MKIIPRSVHFDRARPPASSSLNRRDFLNLSAGAVAVGAAGAQFATPARAGLLSEVLSPLTALAQKQEEALAVLGRNTLRAPLSRPYPNLPAGTDTMPQIQHVVMLMMENHSFDNIFGMLGRGDGFTLGANRLPTAWNPYLDGRIQKAFPMPTTCQLSGKPSQEWKASHIQYAGGNLNGFVISDSGPVAMGYWTRASLPFTYALADDFPIGDRFFCSVLAQTDPNRRYLIAATSAGMTDDIGEGVGNLVPDLSLPLPGNGTIFDCLERTRSAGRTTPPASRWGPPPSCTRSTTWSTCWPRSPSASSSRPPRRARCPASASLTPITAPSRRRTRRTSSSASSSWPRW